MPPSHNGIASGLSGTSSTLVRPSVVKRENYKIPRYRSPSGHPRSIRGGGVHSNFMNHQIPKPSPTRRKNFHIPESIGVNNTDIRKLRDNIFRNSSLSIK